MEPQTAINLIVEEYNKASAKFPTFNSAHGGYAAILEELVELWDGIKTNNVERFTPEAVQVGAMALKFLIDICGEGSTPTQTDEIKVWPEA